MANQPVKLIECPRDAWQGLPRQIPTRSKIEYLRSLIAAGFKHIDAVSFVSPKVVPQMADTEQVLSELEIPTDVEIIGIIVNEKGAERAIATGKVSTLGYPCSISPTFLQRNQNQTPEENLAVLQKIKRDAQAANLKVVVYLSMAFGNPYGDLWDKNEIGNAITKLVAFGVPSISLADTVGVADAELIQNVVSAAIKIAPTTEIGVHLHSTREDAAAKILAAYDCGCRRFDSAAGGLGGCPFAQDALVGNIPTESVIEALKRRGAQLPINLDDVARLNTRIAAQFS